jgi:hypothetical protein
MVVGDVANISNVHAASTFRVETCTSEMSATLPTTTWCNNPRTELSSIINHSESLKSVVCILFILMSYNYEGLSECGFTLFLLFLPTDCRV